MPAPRVRKRAATPLMLEHLVHIESSTKLDGASEEVDLAATFKL